MESQYLIEADKIIELISVDDMSNQILHTGPSLKKFRNSNLSTLRTWLNKITNGKYKMSQQGRLPF